MPVIFPDFITHASVQLREDKDSPVEAISAGFYNMATGEAHGEAESMKLKSVPDVDGKLCTMALVEYPVSGFIDMGFYEPDDPEADGEEDSFGLNPYDRPAGE